jgi:hypothetical protein
MSDEEERDLEPVQLNDGEVFIEDMPEFLERFGAIAVQNRDGALYVLKSENLKWVNVELDKSLKLKAAK